MSKKKMDIEEFVEFGYLQEANRRFFHPLGMELEVDKFRDFDIVTKKATGDWMVRLSLWDRRNSTKVLLSKKVDPEKAKRVTTEMEARRPARRKLPGCNSAGIQRPRG